MNEEDLPYKIKPVIIKKRIFIFIFILFIVILYASFQSGKFDSDMFIFLSIMMFSVFYIIFRFTFRNIYIKSDEFTYKVLLKKITVDYNSINKICILVRKKEHNKKVNTYSLILEGSKNWQISTIEFYKSKDIEFFIDKISIKNQQIALISDELKKSLREIHWPHN